VEQTVLTLRISKAAARCATVALSYLFAGGLLACSGAQASNPTVAAPAAEPAGAAPTPSTSPIRASADIEKILIERVGEDKGRYGIVVGVVDASGRRVVSAGSRTQGDAQPLDENSLFEIGSITKVFTSLLLADAVERERVSLDDPVSKFLPSSVRMAQRGTRPITLLDLATHSSGLPRLPNNLDPADDNNPYADYSVEQLYAFLSTVELTRDPGAQYEYSNVGVGLLGHVLALEAGMDYEGLVRARITEPLGMKSTAIALSPELRARLVPGHTRELEPASNWDLPVLAGAGALRSSAHDMLTFLSAAIGLEQAALAPVFALTTHARRPTNDAETSIGLGWHITKAHGKVIVWHNGGTGGYRSFIGFDPDARVGVAVLTNRSTKDGPDDIGMHLLDPESPLEPPAAAVIESNASAGHTQVSIDPRLLDRYVGRYELTPSAIFTVTRRGDALFVQLSGQSTFPVFPESDTQFFYKVVDAQLTFQPSGEGAASAVTLHQNGRDQRAPRITQEPARRAKRPLKPEVFDRYVGRYELRPQAIMTILRQNDRFFAHLTGQRPVEIFASSEREFFTEVVDAQLTFDVDATGKGVALTLHQNGVDQKAPRVEPTSPSPE
jgi:D-alanyl-D-alanine-carboxypeptidase/D-alanyl-D-alanine-endopeptidase